MENFSDLFENAVFEACVKSGVKTRFINALSKYLERNRKCKEFIWMTEEELECIPGIGSIGAKELKTAQYQILCTKCV